MPDVHHVFSPSSAHRHLECVGYLIGPEIEDKSGDAALEGTVCHKLLEYAQYGMDAEQFVGNVAQLGTYSTGEATLYTKEMAAAVMFFVQTAKDLMLELGIPVLDFFPERHLVHPDIQEELFGGTSDFTAIGEDTLLIIDLKYGTSPVKASSPQLTEYLILALAAMPEEQRAKMKRFVQVIIQPRIAYGEPVDRYEPTVDEIQAVWEKLWNASQMYLVHRHLPESPPELLKTGKHCQYCPRALHCSAITADMSDAAAQAIAPIDTSGPGLLDKLIYWSDKEEAIKSFLKQVNRALVSLAESGHVIPGRKLIASFGNREWAPDMVEKGEQHVLRRLKRALSVPADKARKISVRSPAQIEEYLKAEGLWTGNKDLQSKFQSLVHRPIRGMKLVDADAKGDAITAEMAKSFGQALIEYSE